MRLLPLPFDIKYATTEQLTFVGDAVYSLLVREKLCCENVCRSGDLHARTAKMVKAEGQAKAYKIIAPHLSEREVGYYKKGRNAHTTNTPKGATEAEYHSATGVEALFGYLYLTDQNKRLSELFELIFAEFAEV